MGRWIKDAFGGSDHRCALLSIQPTELWTKAPSNPVDGKLVGELDGQYLLWGEKPSDLGNGWKLLTTSRIGSLEIPFKDDLSDKARVVLKTVEYLREFEFGNIAVAEERLVKLECLKTKSGE